MDCHICGGFLRFLGQLGVMLHFRCENCGHECSHHEEALAAQELEGDDENDAQVR